MSVFDTLYAPLDEHRNLTDAEASAVMSWLIGGQAEEADILKVLNRLCDKGVDRTELVSFVRVMREKAALLVHPFDDLVDTCGTGGGKPTFNLSTAAALVAAGAGVRIAKHGNRSTTGLGSADVLEFLQVRLGLASDTLIHQLETIGIAFLFAPAHHPAMRHVASARKALGRRSVFNLLGPLSNPAGATRQLIGVYDPTLLPLMAEAAGCLGIERALLVHSIDGLDEISPCSETTAIYVEKGAQTEMRISPEDFGVKRLSPPQIAPGENICQSAAMLEEAISDLDSPLASAVIPNASVAIWLSGLEPSFSSAAERARLSIGNGLATLKLAELVESGAR